MALNKFMHPRNIYRNPPDFTQLAKLYDEFAKVAKMDITGKVSIEFKDPCSLRVLTKCLLKKDFNLDVFIPEDRLVPTLPLRLNYILWVEDLLNSIGMEDDIRGLDIGTGACAVYPLLSAKKNKWHMVGTEADEESLMKAKENVARNNLDPLIELRKSPPKSLLGHLFADENAKTFHFSMCNPPFYSNLQELYESRSPARPQPKNAFTGSPQELITDGGELAFCRQMIQESKKLQDKVMIFTTMVGHKYNLKQLELDMKAEGIKYTTTEFCQGRVTRWGLAWTYQHYDIWKLVPPRDSKSRKPSAPMIYLLPEIPGMTYDTTNISNKIKSILQSLSITFKVLNKRGQYLAMDIIALSNTWTNQRRKRRQMKRLQGNEIKKPKLENHVITKPLNDSDFKFINDLSNSNESKQGVNHENENITHLPSSQDDGKKIDTIFVSNMDTVNLCIKDETKTIIECKTICDKGEQVSNNNSLETKAPIVCSTSNSQCTKEPVTHAILKILKKKNEIFMEWEFLDGSAGKEGLHQIVQYIKNNWK